MPDEPLIFEEALWKDLSPDPYIAAHKLAYHFSRAHQSGTIPSPRRNASYIEAMQMFKLFCEDNSVKAIPDFPEIGNSADANINRIAKFFHDAMTRLSPEVVARMTQSEVDQAIQMGRTRYAEITGKGFAYKLSEQDYDQLQSLIDHMRKLLQNTTAFGEQDRSALLLRLEALQKELNRRMVSFDAFILFGADVNLVLQKAKLAAKGAHEITREVREAVTEFRKLAQEMLTIGAIVYATAHHLPSNTPLPLQLPPPADVHFELLSPQEEDGRVEGTSPTTPV